MQAYTRVEPVIVGYDEVSLTLQGTMVKRRCTFADLSAYITGAQGRERAWLDKSAENKRRPSGDRPASDTPQAWGPWTIRHSGPPATKWEIITVHNCPEGQQTNVFASGEWPKVGE